MNDIFITKSGAKYAGAYPANATGIWNVDLLEEGELQIVDGDGALIAPNAATVTADKIQILLGTTEGRAKVSTPLFRAGFSYKKQSYVAPVAAVKHVGDQAAAAGGTGSLNLPAALVVGDSCSIAIRDLSRPVEETSSVRYYSVVANASSVLTGITADNIIAKLIVAINADPSRVANAVANQDGAGNIDGIKLTAITAGNDFAPFVLMGVLQNATIGTTTANVTGIGTAAQVAALEKDLSTRDGYTGRNAPNYMYSVPSKVDSTKTYTVYTLNSKYPLEGRLVENTTYTNVCMIFVPSDETGAYSVVGGSESNGGVITALDSLLAKFVA